MFIRTALVVGVLAVITPHFSLRAQPASKPSFWSTLGPVGGLHIGTPQRASLALGVGMWRRRPDGDTAPLPFVLVEPGLGAHRASAGSMWSVGEWKMVSARASLMRTRDRPVNAEPNQTYAGIEAGAHLFLWTIRGGAFRRTTAGERFRTVLSFDLGLLF